MKVTLYQIIPELDNTHLMFRDLAFVQNANNGKIPAEIYEMVYCGNLDIESLEDVFYIFNMAHPEEFRGRSLSVSDVVEFSYSPDKSDFFFCDAQFGFPKIEFDKRKAMLPIVNHDFQQEETICSRELSIVFCSDCGVQVNHCSKVVLTRCKYSQCQLGYKLRYWIFEEEHWREKEFLSRPKVLLVHNGFCQIPESVLYEYQLDNLKRSKFGIYSDENLKAVEQWCGKHRIKVEYL